MYALLEKTSIFVGGHSIYDVSMPRLLAIIVLQIVLGMLIFWMLKWRSPITAFVLSSMWIVGCAAFDLAAEYVWLGLPYA
jgi:hypothetical protein